MIMYVWLIVIAYLYSRRSYPVYSYSSHCYQLEEQFERQACHAWVIPVKPQWSLLCINIPYVLGGHPSDKEQSASSNIRTSQTGFDSDVNFLISGASIIVLDV